MTRTALKLQYEKFKRSWKNEKAYQRYVVEELGQELPANQPLLRRRPTFSQWCEITRLHAAEEKRKEAEALSLARKTDELDLEWKEE